MKYVLNLFYLHPNIKDTKVNTVQVKQVKITQKRIERKVNK